MPCLQKKGNWTAIEDRSQVDGADAELLHHPSSKSTGQQVSVWLHSGEDRGRMSWDAAGMAGSSAVPAAMFRMIFLKKVHRLFYSVLQVWPPVLSWCWSFMKFHHLRYLSLHWILWSWLQRWKWTGAQQWFQWRSIWWLRHVRRHRTQGMETGGVSGQESGRCVLQRKQIFNSLQTAKQKIN